MFALKTSIHFRNSATSGKCCPTRQFCIDPSKCQPEGSKSVIDRPTSLSGKWSFLFHCMEQLNQLTTVLLAVTVSPSWRSSERAHPSHHTRCTEGLFDVGVNDWPVIVVQNPFFLTSNNFPPKVLLALPGKQRDACVEPTANAVFGEFMRHSLSGFPNSSHLVQSPLNCCFINS
uniref:Secreted protein n=1 Tax=Heterorhabditis bacteriophora TaxID=37862 RepID=A0A1I7WH85_HETBA